MLKNPFAALLCVAALPAVAQDAALQHCRSIEAPATRLACYDAALPPLKNAVPATPSPSPATAARPSPPAAEVTASASSTGAPAVAAATVTTPLAAPKSTEPPANFGFESRRRATDEAADRVVSSYVGTFSGWGPAEKIPLANGQVWQIADGSQTAYDIRNPRVRIVRGAFGSFFMEIEGVSHSPKVRRVQ